jgi:hypothetical protein
MQASQKIDRGRGSAGLAIRPPRLIERGRISGVYAQLVRPAARVAQTVDLLAYSERGG